MPGHLRKLSFAILLSGGALFAQHYQGRDHTVFHRPAPPPARHASNATTATTASTHTADATRRHEGTFSGSSTTHNPQPPQLSPRPR